MCLLNIFFCILKKWIVSSASEFFVGIWCNKSFISFEDVQEFMQFASTVATSYFEVISWSTCHPCVQISRASRPCIIHTHIMRFCDAQTMYMQSSESLDASSPRSLILVYTSCVHFSSPPACAREFVVCLMIYNNARSVWVFGILSAVHFVWSWTPSPLRSSWKHDKYRVCRFTIFEVEIITLKKFSVSF